MTDKYVLWKLSALSPQLASARYRALLPALGLNQLGVRSVFTASARIDLLGTARAVVIVKSFSQDDMVLAEEARRLGVPVFIDLCDNIFVPGYRGKSDVTPAAAFDLLAAKASAVVTPTRTLRDVVTSRVPKGTVVLEITDCAESVEERAEAIGLFERNKSVLDVSTDKRRSLVARAEEIARRFWRGIRARRSSLNQSPVKSTGGTPSWLRTSAPLILWFGNKGNSYTKSGLADLALFGDALQRVAREFGAELLVLTNGHEDAKRFVEPIGIKWHYDDWSLATMESALRVATLVIVPNCNDEFAVCKSSNRSVLALRRGVPVVASPTRALSELRECVWQADAYEGMRLYLSDKVERRKWVKRAERLLISRFSVKAIGQQWRSLLEAHLPKAIEGESIISADVFFALGLGQDLDVVSEIVEACRLRGLTVCAYVALSVSQGSPRVIRHLADRGVTFAVLPDNFDGTLADSVLVRHKAAFFATETSLNPHRFSQRLCKFAHKHGLRTFTVQHGIENVGLTYSDDAHPIQDVKIMSRTIFLWGGLDTLHPDVSNDVRARCRPVGNPKRRVVDGVHIPLLAQERRPIVGVFENLHWQRFSDDYRREFIRMLRVAIEEHRDLLFLLKPHSAGMWLTSRYKGELPKASNLLVIDPSDPDWNAYTAPAFFSYLGAVVTTPSTVALDAALFGLPTAVVRFGMSLDKFKGLPMIDGYDDLAAFMREAISSSDAQLIQLRNQRFLSQLVIEGDACGKIVDVIKQQLTAMGGGRWKTAA